MSNQTSTPADPCAAVLVHIEEDKAVYADQERKADREAQEQAADRRRILDDHGVSKQDRADGLP